MKGATMGTKQTQAASTPGPMVLTFGGSTVDLHLARSAGDTSAKTRVLRMSRAGQDKADPNVLFLRKLAAAPALYEALAGLLSIFDSVTMGQEAELRDEWIPQARAALRQARGEA